jgi:hypothetical protein
MIEPVPVHLSVTCKADDDVNSMEVRVTMPEASLSLAPQALYILLGTPGALAAFFSETKTPPATTATPSFTGQRASEILREVLGQETRAIEAVARKFDEQREKQCRFYFHLQLDALNITLADSIVPVMRIHIEMLPPGIVLYKQSVPSALTLDVKTGAVEVEILNTRNGAWEPVVEHFHFGIQIVRNYLEAENYATHIILNGQEPLLVNLTPTAVQRIAWLLPLFVSNLQNSHPDTLEVEARMQ